MGQPFKLYRLQQIDSQLDWTRARLQEVDRVLNEDVLLSAASQRCEQISQTLQEARESLRQAEDNVRQQRLKIEQNESTLYGGKVRSPKELQDLQNEVASLKRYLVVLEDRQLESMLVEEEAASTYAQANAELEQVRAQVEIQHKELNSERVQLLKEIDRFNEERQAAVTSIPADELHLYETLRVQRRGIAVAKVVDRACSACGSTLNAVLLHAAHSGTQITRCDACGRILYAG
ncbi:MAG: hypothetical protein JXB15_05545 [Anaerolineales bacterium]|nr:hypothetical protein [Anaerolineales bacterium]